MIKLTEMPQTPKEKVHWFVDEKIKLKEQGYPPEKTAEFVKGLYEENKPKVLQIIGNQKNVLFITSPSTSGKNVIPSLYAEQFQPNGILTIDGTLLASPHHVIESKSKPTLEKRTQDPINFIPQANIIQTRNYINSNFKNIYIVDDILTTGENAVKFKKVLESNGILINGILPIMTIGKYKATEKEIENGAKIFNEKSTYSPEQEKLIKDRLTTVFADYTGYKLFKFMREIKTNSITREKGFNVLYTAYLQEKAFLMKNKIDYPSKNSPNL